jgi:hypothetical protein
MGADWVRLAREVVTGSRHVKIESTVGGYTSADGSPIGRPLIMVSVVNVGTPLIRLTGAALTLNNGGSIPFVWSRADMPPLPRPLSETEEHVFVMDLDQCIRFLRSETPPRRLQDVVVYTTTGDVRKRVSKTLQSAEEVASGICWKSVTAWAPPLR